MQFPRVWSPPPLRTEAAGLHRCQTDIPSVVRHMQRSGNSPQLSVTNSVVSPVGNSHCSVGNHVPSGLLPKTDGYDPGTDLKRKPVEMEGLRTSVSPGEVLKPAVNRPFVKGTVCGTDSKREETECQHIYREASEGHAANEFRGQWNEDEWDNVPVFYERGGPKRAGDGLFTTAGYSKNESQQDSHFSAAMTLTSVYQCTTSGGHGTHDGRMLDSEGPPVGARSIQPTSESLNNSPIAKTDSHRKHQRHRSAHNFESNKRDAWTNTDNVLTEADIETTQQVWSEVEIRLQQQATLRRKRADQKRRSREKMKLESPELYQEKLRADAEAKRRKRMLQRAAEESMSYQLKSQSTNTALQDTEWPGGTRPKQEGCSALREARLRAQAEAARIRRLKETPEQRKARNRATIEARKKRLLNETPEERQARLFYQAMRRRQLRQSKKHFDLNHLISNQDGSFIESTQGSKRSGVLVNKTTEEREAMRKVWAEQARLRRQRETPEQTEARRRAQAQAARMRRQKEMMKIGHVGPICKSQTAQCDNSVYATDNIGSLCESQTAAQSDNSVYATDDIGSLCKSQTAQCETSVFDTDLSKEVEKANCVI